MRFVTPYPGYKLVAIHQRVEHLADGTVKVHEPGFIVEFRTGDYTVWERDAAYERFGGQIRRGQRMEMDMVTPAATEWRVGSYDTATIDDPDVRKKVEDALLSNQANGLDYLHVPRPEVPAPWPNYPRLTAQGRRTTEMVVEQIREKIVDLGVTAEQVAAYERTHLNRPEVLAMLDRLEDEAGAVEGAAVVVGA